MSQAVAFIFTIVGLGMIAAGLDLSHRIDGLPGQILSALAPLGVFAAAAGAVSLFVPDFF